MPLPVSAILPTRNRPDFLARCLSSLAQQQPPLIEIVICDSSDDDQSRQVAERARCRFSTTTLLYLRAARIGLAPQRNQAIAASTQPYVWFLDDDVILEPDCLQQLHSALVQYPATGGVTATLTNQAYSQPGPWTLALMRWFEGGVQRKTYATACVGPGWTFWPDASPAAPALSRAEWLIGCCSMYRREALPSPAVPDHFEGGAFGEDLAASLSVGQRWELKHVRDARVFHDSQGGDHKRNLIRVADQTLRNRWYIMTKVMGQDTPRDALDLALMHGFQLLAQLRSPADWSRIPLMLTGWCIALWKLASLPPTVSSRG